MSLQKQINVEINANVHMYRHLFNVCKCENTLFAMLVLVYDKKN